MMLIGAPVAAASGDPSGGSGTSGTPTTTTPTTTPAPTDTGGTGLGEPPAGTSTPTHPIVQGFDAKVIDGIAYAPSLAPIEVQRAIWAGNKIRRKPYIWGGGHQAFSARGYDCSGSVSYVLHAAGLLNSPFDSSQFMKWGAKGLGEWITVYTNPGHAFVDIAGIRFDTSSEGDPHPGRGTGPRWRPLFKVPRDFKARHPRGF